MWIDIVFLILALYSLWKGWQQGFIISLFVTIAWVAGIIGALKLCGVTAVLLRDNMGVTSRYTPVIAFMLIFLLIVFSVYLIGKALEKIIQIIQLGFINRILGGILRILIFTFMFSLFVWLINQAGLIAPETKTESRTYSFLQYAAEQDILFFGRFSPFVQNIFHDIEHFFENVALKARTSA